MNIEAQSTLSDTCSTEVVTSDCESTYAYDASRGAAAAAGPLVPAPATFPVDISLLALNRPDLRV